MGNGVSASSERERAVNASDIQDLDSAIQEIIRLRHLARDTEFDGFAAERDKPEDASDLPNNLRVCIAEVQRLRALIKVKIPTAERLRKQVKKEHATENLQMTQQLYRRKFEDALARLSEVRDTQIHQIRAINDPTPELKLVVEAVATVLLQTKKKKTKQLGKWTNCRAALAEEGFRDKMLQWNLDSVKAKPRQRISKICEDPMLNNLETAAGSPNATVVDTVALAFMMWVRAVNAYCAAIYPKKDAIKQLSTEIKALRTPEEELGERFMNGRMQGLKSLHRFLDKDGNGLVSFKEMQQFLTRYNCKNLKKKSPKVIKEKVEIAFEQTKKLTSRGDVDGKYICAADLDFTEFVSFMLTIFHVIFTKIDKNRNGTVEVDEVKELLLIMYGTPENGKKHTKMFKKLKKFGKGDALTQDVFTDFMIKTLNSKASKKRALLPRLLSMAVSEKDWQAAKQVGAKSNFIQTALAAEASGETSIRVPHSMGPPSTSKPATTKDAASAAAGASSP